MSVKKIVIRIGLVVLGLIAGELIFLQIRAGNVLNSYVERKIPPNMVLKHGKMSVNIFTGTLRVEDVFLQVSDRDSLVKNTEVTAEEFKLSGLDYWQFYVNNTISVDEIRVDKPVYRYFKHARPPYGNKAHNGVVKLLKMMRIKKIAVNDGQFLLMKDQGDTTELVASAIHFELLDGKTDPDIIRQEIPFTYQSYTFSSSNIFVDLGPFELLQIAELNIRDKDITMKDINLHSKYDKQELSRRAAKERDHLSLKIPEAGIANINYGFHHQRFFANSDSISVSQPHLEVFRDKRLPDDTSIKRLYTQMLRELPIDVETPLVTISDGFVKYEEKIEEHPEAGIFLDDIDIKIRGLDNQVADSTGHKLTLDATANLMGTAPLVLACDLSVFDPEDRFLIKGSISQFRCRQADLFIRPMLGVEAEGNINKMYFTFNGDRNASSGEMKMNYEDFKFKVLAKDGERVNKLLTAIGNLFINDGSAGDDEGFRFGEMAVGRNKTKSFFNYIWINIRDGIRSVITGDGKKD